MTTGIANENAEEEKTKLQVEPMIEVLPKHEVEPPLYVKIREVSTWFHEILNALLTTYMGVLMIILYEFSDLTVQYFYLSIL